MDLKLIWSEPAPPCKECPYDHTIAETPFGRFFLAWEGWKDQPFQDPGYGFDETPWGKVEYPGLDSVEHTQRWAEEEMSRRIAEYLERAALSALDDAISIATGCLGYGGGYRTNPHQLEAFHHGIETVVNALTAARKAQETGENDTQVTALRRSTL